jgi:hypothetical protein
MKIRKSFVPLLLLLSSFPGCCCYDVCSTCCLPATGKVSKIPDAPAPVVGEDGVETERGGFIEAF